MTLLVAFQWALVKQSALPALSPGGRSASQRIHGRKDVGSLLCGVSASLRCHLRMKKDQVNGFEV